MTAYGGLFGLVKFLDLIGFREVFLEYHQSPERKTELGCHRMVLGFLILLFVGLRGWGTWNTCGGTRWSVGRRRWKSCRDRMCLSGASIWQPVCGKDLCSAIASAVN